METPSSSAPPPPTMAITAAASIDNEADYPSRRFPEYQPYAQEGEGPVYSKEWLSKYLEEPRAEELEKMIYYEDDLCVVLYDRFPKAQYHLLLVAKNPPMKQPMELRREHLPTLRRLHDVGKKIADELSRQDAGKIRCGYHAIPVAEPLHMHIISQDFDSPWLKAPKHWNRFTTGFFLDSSWTETRLEEQGDLKLKKKTFMKLANQPTECFRCGLKARVKVLKKHNLECAAPLPRVGAPESHGKSA